MRTRGLVLLLLLGLGALVLALLRAERPGGARAGAAGEGESAAPRAAAELAPPAAEPSGAHGAPAEPDPSASAREAAAERIPHGPIRGRLVEEPGGRPLLVERLVLLASPDDRVAEALHTDARGTFTTTRAFPRGLVRAWVRDPDTKELRARHEAPFDPEAGGEWLIPVPVARPAGPGEAVLHGRVVALDGLGIEGALVKALPLGGEGPPVAELTGPDGHFRLDELAPGRHRVLALGGFAVSAPLELELEENEHQGAELVLPVRSSPGPIRGRLVAEPGGEDPFGVLLLRDLAGGNELAFLTEFFGDDDGETPFELAGVPPGEYELSVVTIDGRSYEPSALRVEPPRDGLEFRARSATATFYEFALRDRPTGDPLEDGIALVRTHGQWWGGRLDVPVAGGSDQWVLYGPGHRCARGGFAQAVPAGTDEEGYSLARIEVGLEPGFAAAILFKDAAGTRLVVPRLGDYFGDGLAGVQVFADGALVAESDADGLALVDLPRAPESLHFGRPGWRVVGEREEEGIRWVQMIRE